MKSKNVFLAIATVFLSSLSSFSQEELPETPEIYLSSSNPFKNNFGIQLKMPLANKKTYFRLGVMNINARVNSDEAIQTNDFNRRRISLNFSGQVGLEKRKSYNKVQLFYGADVYGKYGFSRNTFEAPVLDADERKQDAIFYGVGLAFRSGVIYNFSKNLSLAADINPVISYNHYASDVFVVDGIVKDISTQYDFDFGLSSCWLSLVIHLNK